MTRGGKRKTPFLQSASKQHRAVVAQGVGCPSFTPSHLGVAKPVLLPVHVDGAQKLLRSIFTINELPFRYGAGIEDPVSEKGARRVSSGACWLLGVRGTRASGRTAFS